MPDQGQNLVYEAGQWQIHLGRRELRSQGVPVPIGARAFEIVEVLVQSANELVTRDDLMSRIWPGATVVRKHAPGACSGDPQGAWSSIGAMLKTESGRGYRLLGDWTVRRHDAAKPPTGLQRMRVGGESPVTNFPATVTRLIGRSRGGGAVAGPAFPPIAW